MTTVKNRFFFFLTGNFKYLKADGWTARATRNKILKKTRNHIYKRDNNTCRYCHTQLQAADRTLDHYIPYKDCLSNNTENLVTSCGRCNNLKGSINPERDVKRWEKFLTKTAGKRKVQTSIRKLEDNLHLDKININEFMDSLASELEKQPAKLYSFTRKTNVFLRKNYPNIWARIYINSHINSKYLMRA